MGATDPLPLIPSRREGCVFAVIFITFLLVLVYGRAILQNEFVEWDDGLLILNNPIIQELNWDNIKTAFTSYDPELYIPLTFLSYQLDYAIWGLNPIGFHLTNLLLHIGNAFLIVWFLKRLGWRWAIFGGALFAIHPLNTEAVMWASARKDLLMGLFFLWSLNLYLVGRKHLSLAAFLLACLAKVTAVMLPFILLLIDWRAFSLSRRERDRVRGSERAYVLQKMPYFFISILFIIIALFGKAGSHGLWWEKVLIGSKATMFYLQKLFWPTGLSVLYPYTQKIALSNPDLLVPLILFCFVTLIVGYEFVRAPRSSFWSEVGFGWFFFLLLLAPSFTNFAKGQDILKDVYFASDRYAYLASIGIPYVTVLFLSHIPCPVPRQARDKLRIERSGVGIIGLFGILGLFSFLSYHQSLVWQTTESLFTNVVQHYPDSHVAQNNLGSLYYRRGETDRAIEKYKESLNIRPNATAFFNLGVIYRDNGYPAIAREAFIQTIKLHPADEEAKRNLEALGI
ncbi:tetratricopeptide repeat protein [Candidatus Peregrinibacteria bacterium]|nr:tetratricopeptide repeat protein [Candidatus Peregrinibacteria bacterium]